MSNPFANGYRDGEKLSLEQAIQIAKTPRLYADWAQVGALYVLGEYVETIVKLAEAAKDITNGQVQG